MSFLIPYFDSEWTFAWYQCSHHKTKVAFGSEENTLIIISYDGKYTKVKFDPINGGECTLIENRILNLHLK